MLEILPGPDHVAAYKLSGTLTGEDYDRIIADIEARLGRHKKIGALVDLTGFTDITAEAAGKDIGYGLRKIWQLDRFPREALITDREWMRLIARTASALLPFVEIRSYAPGEAAAAMKWVAAIEVGEDEKPGVVMG